MVAPAWHDLLKLAHVVSSTVLFGTGLGTMFQWVTAHRTGDVRAIANTTRNVVLADWIFTTTSGVIQPTTGIGLVLLDGYSPWSSWLVATYILYIIAGLCWLPVVGLQLRGARLAAAAARKGSELPAEYFRVFRIWFWLGWPAFIGLGFVFYLMTAKPTLW